MGLDLETLKRTWKTRKCQKTLKTGVFGQKTLKNENKTLNFFEDLENRSSQIIPKHYTLARCISDWIWNYTYLEIIPKLYQKYPWKQRKTPKKPWKTAFDFIFSKKLIKQKCSGGSTLVDKKSTHKRLHGQKFAWTKGCTL